MSIKVKCPSKHWIATVEITDTGIVPRGLRHGLVWDYAPESDITRIHARCFKHDCTYDGSIDYRALCTDLAAAAARGETVYVLTY